LPRIASSVSRRRLAASCDVIAVDVLLQRERFPFEEVAAAVDAIERGLIRAQDQAGVRVASVGDAGHVAPRVGRVARVHPDRVAVHAPSGLPGTSSLGPAALVAQDQLVGGQRDRLAHHVRRKTLRQRPRRRLSGLFRRTAKIARLSVSTNASSADFVPGARPISLNCSSIAGQHLRGLSDSAFRGHDSALTQ
jgi:hypothetical protein